MVHGSNPAHHLFLYSLQAKNDFYIFKWLGKKSKEESSFMAWEIISNSNFGVHNADMPTHLWRDYGSFCAATELSNCNTHYMTAKPKIFTIWPFTEEVYWLLF